ncbi:MAG: DUF3307 domain-containing protein [Heliobacteriaceae bacterium]|nr:DUF3307 domain-containing protein [Heliobacteriaceae bacterium]MDD4587337.1 DUF3307 domain-containing protein [Heliobacteriaceae bacterium]
MKGIVWLWLAHFIGDFPLQTDRMVKQKMAGLPGVAIHGLVVSLVILAVLVVLREVGLGQYSVAQIGIFVGLHFVCHVGQDYIKIQWDQRQKKGQNLFSFFIDQGVHLLLLALLVLLLDPGFGRTGPDPVALGLISLVLAVYVTGIVVQIRLNQLYPLVNGRFFGAGEKSRGLLLRICSWVLGFTGGKLAWLLLFWVWGCGWVFWRKGSAEARESLLWRWSYLWSGLIGIIMGFAIFGQFIPDRLR